MPFPGVLWLWHFLYSVGLHPLSSLHIYPLLCRGHSWLVRLAKQETLTPPGHLVSPLVCRGPWMSTVVLYCWCHSDSASVLLYFTLKPSIICIFNENKEEYNVKTSENDVEYSHFNMGGMGKYRKLYSREGDNSSRFEGKTVAWEHTRGIWKVMHIHP